jgi:hypothetical protein
MIEINRLNKWMIVCVVLCVSICCSQTKEKNSNDMEEYTLLTTQEKNIGIGILQVSLNCDIPLYHTETGRVVDTIRFSVIDEGEYKGKFKASTKYAFAPMKYYAGDSEVEAARNINQGLTYFVPELSFRVLKCVENGYEIVLNEDLFETAIIRSDNKHKLYTRGKPSWAWVMFSTEEAWMLYETWDAYLKRAVRVSLRGQKLYDDIDGKEFRDDEIHPEKIVDVKGNWIKIRAFASDSNGRKTAWVQWTDGKELLVNLAMEVFK